MDLLELQKRANILVEQVNTYEASLTEEYINEEEVLVQQKFADIYSLRPVLKLIFGDSIESKTDKTLNNNVKLPLFASSAPMWNTTFDLLDSSVPVTKDKHEFMNNIDMVNNHNMIQLDVTQNSLVYNNSIYSDREMRIRQGINFSYSSNIADAIATESQLANVFKWNTQNNLNIKNNTVTVYRQVPGIVVYYIGNGNFNPDYTPTISHSTGSTLNEVTFNYPFFNGAAYLQEPIWDEPTNHTAIESQDPGISPDYNSLTCSLKMFIPSTHYTLGKLESPQQIYIPPAEPPEYKSHSTAQVNISTYNYQAHALYHELVFKNRRKGASENKFDFIPTLESVADNDPQGLATRVALAKNKKYYVNRPFFNELKPESEFDTSKLADSIIENSHYYKKYYEANTDYLNSSAQSKFDTSTATIAPDTNNTPTITCTITNGSDNDSATGDNSTQYVAGAVVLSTNWSDISSEKQMFTTQYGSIYCGPYNSDISFGWQGMRSGTSITIKLDELNDDSNELVVAYTLYGTRLYATLYLFNKTTNELVNKGNIYNTTSSSYSYIPQIFINANPLDIKSRGINIESINGRLFNGDVGQLREFSKSDGINRLVDLSITKVIDRDRKSVV